MQQGAEQGRTQRQRVQAQALLRTASAILKVWPIAAPKVVKAAPHITPRSARTKVPVAEQVRMLAGL